MSFLARGAKVGGANDGGAYVGAQMSFLARGANVGGANVAGANVWGANVGQPMRRFFPVKFKISIF